MRNVQIKGNQVIYLFKINLVRAKATYCRSVLEDREKYEEDRKSYSQWNTRIQSVGSGQNSYGSSSSESYGGGGRFFSSFLLR